MNTKGKCIALEYCPHPIEYRNGEERAIVKIKPRVGLSAVLFVLYLRTKSGFGSM